MSSGRRVIQINNLERAISPDINRLQAFNARDSAESDRYLHDVLTDDVDPGLIFIPVSAGTNAPATGAEIHGGLMARPQVGSLAVLVDAGVIQIIAPDGGADDSTYKFIKDPGVTVVGSLVLTTNPTGSIRIDVIECRPNPLPLVVTDSRDIYDPITNLFTPNVVTKETAYVLEYRVRAGVAGSGFPGLAAGWVALAVASVPAGMTINDTVTFWDVRPLISDRAFNSNVSNILLPHIEQLDARVLRQSAASSLLNGYFRANLLGRRIGGQFRRGGPGVDTAASIDIGDIANQGAIITEPLTGHVFVYCCTPHGLPRWARYTNAPAARLPRTTKGLLVVSYVLPDLYGNPVSAIPMPASTGLLGSTGDAVCVAIVPKDNLNRVSELHVTNKAMRMGEWTVPIVSAVFATGNYAFTVPDTEWPPNAKAAYCQCLWTFTLPATQQTTIFSGFSSFSDGTTTESQTYHPNANVNVANFSGGALLYLMSSEVHRIPLPVKHSSAPSNPRLINFGVATFAGAPVPSATANLQFLGFDI